MKVRLPKSGMGGMGNIQQLAQKAQVAQEEMGRIEEEINQKDFIATSGGEAVKVTVTGDLTIKLIEIKPEVISPDDAEMLADLIIAATNEALKKAKDEKASAMENITGGFNLPGLF